MVGPTVDHLDRAGDKDLSGFHRVEEGVVGADVAAHSIIAVQGDGPIETGDDGVVSYKSAHIDGVASELVVRSSHSVQGDPHTVAEVRRILLLHLAQACPQGCVPAAPTERSVVVSGPIGKVQPPSNASVSRRNVLSISQVGVAGR